MEESSAFDGSCGSVRFLWLRSVSICSATENSKSGRPKKKIWFLVFMVSGVLWLLSEAPPCPWNVGLGNEHSNEWAVLDDCTADLPPPWRQSLIFCYTPYSLPQGLQSKNNIATNCTAAKKEWWTCFNLKEVNGCGLWACQELCEKLVVKLVCYNFFF